MASYEKILCAVDAKAQPEAAIGRAVELARGIGAGLTVLQVVGYFPEDRSNDYIPPENEDPASSELEIARRELVGIAATLGVEESEVEVRHSAESPTHEVLERVREDGYDLVVVAARDPQGLARLLPTSADRLAHTAPCDVLVVHHHGD